jgi:hypothetical protein
VKPKVDLLSPRNLANSYSYLLTQYRFYDDKVIKIGPVNRFQNMPVRELNAWHKPKFAKG